MADKTKKKILLLITKSNWGGAQRYVYDLATNLPPEKFDVAVMLGGDGVLIEKLEAAGIRTIPIHQLTNTLSPLKLQRIIVKIRHVLVAEQPDILHCNSSIGGLAGVVAGRLARTPRVLFTAHGWAFNEDRPLWQKLIFKFFHWVTVSFSHHTITVSNAVRRQMNWPFVRTKMNTVYLGHEPAALLSRNDARDALVTHQPSLAPYRNDTWLISIGELHPVKQHRVAIEALRSIVSTHPTARYLIIGDGQLQTELTNLIAEHNLTEHVFLLGHVAEAARYLAAADVFVFPSRSEALGYVALEAAHAGVPTVASNVGGIPEVITDGASGTLVPSGDHQAIATAIATYLTDANLAAQHAAAAERSASHFTIDAMVAGTIACYTNGL